MTNILERMEQYIAVYVINCVIYLIWVENRVENHFWVWQLDEEENNFKSPG